MQLKKIRISKLRRFYFVLGSITLVVVFFSLFVNRKLGLQLESMVEVNEFFARQVINMERLQSLASDINAPANDIFTSNNVQLERKRYNEALQKFSNTYEAVFLSLSSHEFDNNFSFEPTKILLMQTLIEMEGIKKDTELIFKYFSKNQKNQAGRAMSSVDRRFAKLRAKLHSCSTSIREVRHKYLQDQKKWSEKIRLFEIIFLLIFALLIIGAVSYGAIISKFISTALRQSKMAEEQKKALDAAAIVAITDKSGVITYANDKFAEVSGYTKSELIGQNHRIINSGYHSKEFFKNLWTTISNGEIWRGEIKNKRKDGTYYWVDSTVVPMKDENEKVFQYIAIRHEVSQRKFLEETMQKAKEEAIKATQTKTQFLANMSHEIRTPLNGILGMATLLSDESLSADGLHHLNVLKNSCDTLLVLINDILDFSKLEAGKVTLEKKIFNLETIVYELSSLLYLKAKEKGNSIHIEIAPTLPKYVCADVTRFKQVLTNLLGNAIKFTQDGSVTIRISLEDDSIDSAIIRVDVEDNGIGISKEDQSALFRSFSQVDASTTRKYGGTGLGLAICKGICEAMGGHIWVKSTYGKGSVFSFTFKTEKTENRLLEKIENPPTLDQELAKKIPLQILVADDFSVNQLMAQKFLKKLGYEPDIVGNGIEVLKNLESKSYDVIFMDGHMPELDGYDTTKKIHEIFGKKNSPWIIAFTANASKEDRANCLDIGMDDFVSKPFTMQNLAQAISRIPNRNKIKNKENSSMTSDNPNSFNESVILKHFAEDEDILMEVVTNFLPTVPKILGEIEVAIKEKRAKELEVSAHTLKGSVSNFFVKDLQQLLFELEQMGRRSQFDGALEKFNQARKQLNRLCVDLQSLLSRKKAG